MTTAATPAGNTAAGPFEVTHRLVLSIAIPMTLGFLTTPLIGLTDTAVALLGILKIGLGWPLQLAALGAMVWVLGRNQTPIEPPPEPTA